MKEKDRGNVYGGFIFKYKRRVRAIHYFHFFCTTKKVITKIKNIKNYFKEEEEYRKAKLGFDALPTSYQRKEKLEKIENGQ